MDNRTKYIITEQSRTDSLNRGGIMDKFKMGINIIQGIFSLVHFAEALFSDTPKTGEQKAKLVLEGTKGLVHAAENITTGGAHNTWEKIEKIAPDMIDSAANMLYPPNK